MAFNILQKISVCSSSGFLKRSWGDDCVVYATESRETHLLNLPCALVLERVEEGPTSFTSLIRELRDLTGCSDEKEVNKLLHEVISSLIKIGLIQVHEEVF